MTFELIEEARNYLNPTDIQVVVYHKGCQDGMTAALCAWKVLGDGTNVLPIEYIPMHYKDDIRLKEYANKNVLLVDFSWTPEQLAEVRKVANKVMVLDHHRSAMVSLQSTEGCFFDMEESGASLAWYYFNPGEDLPFFIKYVKDRDIWKWEYREQSEPMYYGIKDIWHNSFRDYDKYLLKVNLSDLIEHGRQVIEKQQEWIRKVAKNATQQLITLPNGDIYNVMVLELEKPKLVSEIAEYLYTNNDVHFTICWFRHKGNKIPRIMESWAGYRPVSWFWKEQKYILSFRSNREGVDVSEIAGMFGGGGHAKAAGAQLDCHPRAII